MTTESISPNPFAIWFHEFIAQPYHEGALRIKRAVLGIDFSFMDCPELSQKNRVVSFLVGCALLIPFINTIIWVAMRFFGEADVLAAPFPTERPPSPSSSPLKKVRFAFLENAFSTT